MEKEVTLGNKVRDIVTGFEGIAISRIEYLNGCIQYGVKPKVNKDGKHLDVEYIDQEQIEVISKGVTAKVTKLTSDTPGGDQPDAPKF